MNRLRNPRLALRGRADRGRRARGRPRSAPARSAPATPSDRRRDQPHATAAPTPEPSLFAGIEQHGAALGSPKAPVTLVEYADLQCPYCAQWARDDDADAGRGLREDRQAADRLPRPGLHRLRLRQGTAHRDRRRRGRPSLGRRPRPLPEPGLTRTPAGSPTSSSPRSPRAFPASTARSSSTPAGTSSVEPELERAAAAAQAAGVNGTPDLPGRPDRRPAGARSGRLARSGGDRSGDRGGAGAMNERTLRLASAALAVARSGDHRRTCSTCAQTGGELVCSTGGCETVQSSSYAEVLGVPVAALGLLGFLGLLAAALAPRRVGADDPGHARALGVLLQRLPALHPGGRDRGDLPVVPRDRRHHDRDRRFGAPAPSPRRGGRAYAAATNAPASQAPADRWQEAEAASADTLTETPHPKPRCRRRVALDLG